ncbi:MULTISPECIES: LysE family translocator [unclassified Vibrio]|uniref:LysE family translocator n=1 Tax=Gammaproteobacteria TaxID=1236 RepID=UPI0010A64E50|nr:MULTISPECIES: LysE family translocator [unclassified Vibrio]WGY47034.1 LysE family translocator [Vibrio sp. ABG19]
MYSVLGAMALFAFVGSISPGPVNVMATYAGARYGWRKASIQVLGASLAFVLVVMICGMTLSGMSAQVPVVVPVMRWIGSAYLLYLAVRILLLPGLDLQQSVEVSSAGLLSQGALVQLFNPKAWIFASSGVSLYVLNQTNLTHALGWFCLIALVVCFTGVGIWALLGQSLVHWLNSRQRQRLFQVTLAAMLAVSVFMIWMVN